MVRFLCFVMAVAVMAIVAMPVQACDGFASSSSFFIQSDCAPVIAPQVFVPQVFVPQRVFFEPQRVVVQNRSQVIVEAQPRVVVRNRAFGRTVVKVN